MALIQCPDCRKHISETAEACPNCGFVLTSETVATLKERKKKDETVFVLFGCGAVFFLVVFFSVLASSLSSQSSSHKSYSSGYQPEPSMSQKLAAIEVKSASGASDSVLSSAMRRRLERLARKFPESEDQIANMTVTSKQILEREGIAKSLTEIMDEIDYMIPSGELGVTYAESAALYVTAQSR
jgi:hypothetical protein